MLSIVSFWIMCAAMSVMTFALTFAGVIQVHLQRVLGQSYMEVQDQLALFYWIRLGSGIFVLISAAMFVYAVFVPGREKAPRLTQGLQPAE
jgi:nitric oxide reductase subunit B